MALAVVVMPVPLRAEEADRTRGAVVPGPWFRATALLALGATVLVVVSGALRPGLDHRATVLAALVLLVALWLTARLIHRRLLPLAGAALGLTCWRRRRALWSSSSIERDGR